MTFLEKIKQDLPNVPLDYEDCPWMCPRDVGYENEKWCSNKSRDYVNCYTCWRREMPTRKTYKDLLLEVFPKAEMNLNGFPKICPKYAGITGDDKCEQDCSDCMVYYWGKEVQE